MSFDMYLTEKLYNTDSYLAEFSCKVLSVYKTNKGYEVITDKTAFFPEAGGQSCDKGTLDGFVVNHILIDGETVIHQLSDFTAQIGSTVTGKIDMQKRVTDMQQHTGEHILSGTAQRLFGCENVGFHLGEETVTVDLSIPLNAEQINLLEKEANSAVRRNVPVVVTFPTAEELETINYRSKKEIDGQVRIVTINGVDCCACCAPHLSSTGEVGLIRILSFENHRGGTRLSVLCGEKAIDDIQKKLAENKKTGAMFCVKELETSTAAQRLLKEKSNLEFENNKLRLEILKLKAGAFNESDRIIAFEDCTDTNTLRELMNCLIPKSKSLVAVFGRENGVVSKYVLCTPGGDISFLCKSFNRQFNARGGGRGEMAQGSVSAKEDEIRDFLTNTALSEDKI